jgi:hypothetical protein
MLWSVGHDRALVVNNDVILRSDCARRLRDILEGFGQGRPFGIVSGIGVDREDLSPRTLQDLVPSIRDHPDFSCFMISKLTTDLVGFFDEEMFPAFAEDSDMHVRMHRAGIRAVAIDMPFLHVSSGTLKNASPSEQSAIRRGADRNRERFRAKYGCLPGTDAYQELFR